MEVSTVRGQKLDVTFEKVGGSGSFDFGRKTACAISFKSIGWPTLMIAFLGPHRRRVLKISCSNRPSASMKRSTVIDPRSATNHAPTMKEACDGKTWQASIGKYLEKRRARDSNPQPVSRHLISSQAANHSLTLLGSDPN
jgi:hypothetical protein